MYEAGHIIGQYEIREQLGQGGMATVYKAHHVRLDRYVAIKVLHPALKQEDGFTERFTREAQLVARLDHPNIVTIHDFDEHSGDPYLVMNYIEGQTLKSWLKEHQPTYDEITRIITSVGDALAYAHDRGLLHRDVKPSNIMLDTSGKVYLTDFGLARMAQAGDSTMSRDMMLGTPQYISPEQAMGHRKLDARTDIYSLGVVIYELIVGRVPFSADTPFAIVHDHIFTPLPSPSAINPKVPRPVEDFLQRALAKRPEDRFGTIREMMAAFEIAMEESGPEAITTASQIAPRTAEQLKDLQMEANEGRGTRVLPQQKLDTPSIRPDALPPPLPEPEAAPVAQQPAAVVRSRPTRTGLWALTGLILLLITLASGGFVFYTAITEEFNRVYEQAPEPEEVAPADEESRLLLRLTL